MARGTQAVALIFVFAALFSWFGVPQDAQASGATLIVNGQGDEDPSNSLCDLVEAVKAAVANADYGDCSAANYGDDTIEISGTLLLTQPLEVNGGGNLIIQGPGQIHWNGKETSRLLSIDGTTGPLEVSLKDVHLVGNSNPGLAVQFARLIVEDSVLEQFGTGSRGAAIRGQPQADIVIRRSILRNNRAGVGGAISLFPTDKGAAGSLFVEQTTFENNRAVLSGGAIRLAEGSVVIVATTFEVIKRNVEAQLMLYPVRRLNLIF